MKIFIGLPSRFDLRVFVAKVPDCFTFNGNPGALNKIAALHGQELDPRLDLRNHSPTGFACGYGGSGPAQLALAILAELIGDERALNHYQDFKWNTIGGLPPDEQWLLREPDIHRALKRAGAA